MSMTNWKTLTLANIIKTYIFNIFKMSQWFYLITKQKLNENEITSKRKMKEIQSSITSKSNVERIIKKNITWVNMSNLQLCREAEITSHRKNWIK